MSQFFVEYSDINKITAEAVLRNEEAKHLSAVHRAKKGDEIAIFDGQGNRWKGVFKGGDVTEAYLINLKPLPANESRLQIELITSLTKTGWDAVLDRGTQLGVAKFRPIESVRTVVRVPKDKIAEKTARWTKIAKSAAKQCERGIIPEIAAPTTLKELLAEIKKPDPGELRFFLSERTDNPPVQPLKDALPTRILLAVGPEGGWTSLEKEKLGNAGFYPISLGGRILRTDAATMAGIIFLQAKWGDLASFFSQWQSVDA